MKKLSLKSQIILIAAIPFLFFAGTMLWGAISSYGEYRDAEISARNLELLEAVSRVAHQTQAERGRSAGYLSGGPQDEMNAQRAVTDREIANLGPKLAASGLSEQAKRELRSTLGKFEGIRKEVSSKSVGTAEAIARYSVLVSEALKMELDVAARTELAEVKSAILSLAILEEAKESGGKLRANMAAALTRNSPLTDEQFQSIVTLKGRVDANLASPGLVVSAEGKRQLAAFASLPEWIEVDRTFKLILVRAEQGKFDVDPKRFFGTITAALNQVEKMVQGQLGFAREKADAARSSARATLIASVIFLVLMTFAVGAVALGLTGRVSRTLLEIVRDLSGGSVEVAGASDSIASSSVQLSQNTTEQAAAFQETATAIDEINAIAGKNSESARESQEVASRSQEVSTRGKDTVARMIESIQTMSRRSAEVMNQVRDGNVQISEVVQLISEIGDKTKVINDIVFQTKLLSFNASVEAARAGEHGKGFAVVAEEVGNLAQMSGMAAQEISDLLEGSTAKVRAIVEDVSGRTEALVAESDKEVRSATETAQECGRVLDEILENATRVCSILNEVARSSSEQSKGVEEITRAMQQMSAANQQTTAVAEQSSVAARQLKAQAEALRSFVQSLQMLVQGGEGAVGGSESVAFVEPEHLTSAETRA